MHSSISCRPTRAAPLPSRGRAKAAGLRSPALKDNMARESANIPPESLSKVIVRNANGAEVTTIPNAEGKRASLVFYAATAAKHGPVLSAAAATHLLALYDEVTAEARAHRGSHPNIDLPLDVLSGDVPNGPLTIEVIKA